MRNPLVLVVNVALITPLGCNTGEKNPSDAAPNGGGGTDASGGSSGHGPAAAGSSQGGNAGGAPAGGAGAGGTASLPATLKERIRVSDVPVAAGVKEGVMNWRVWGREDLDVAPVFTAPLPSCETLVCFTSGSAQSPAAHVVRLSATDTLAAEVVSVAGVECRGVAAGADGQLAALLWNESEASIAVTRYDAAGAVLGSTQLVNDDNAPTDFEIGESRLEFGGGKYGAYYHVHSDSGHEGDTLKWIDAASGAETTEWSWGCSHSMSNLLRYNPALNDFLPACVTDCYPGTNGSDFETTSLGGIYLNHDDAKVLDVNAGCNGSVAGELGGAALAPMGWKLVFNAHQAPATPGQQSYDEGRMNQDIGFSAVSAVGKPGPVVWLTTTPANEADATISRFDSAGPSERYLVGWAETGQNPTYKLALLDAQGAFLEAPIDVGDQVRWGHRDDPFREHVGGDVVWAWFEAAGSTTLRVGRVSSGASARCPSARRRSPRSTSLTATTTGEALHS